LQSLTISVVKPFSAKLTAIRDVLNILPSYLHTSLFPSTVTTRSYKLQPRTCEHLEAIFLRHRNTLNFPKIAASVTCQWTDQVQVSSSATDAVQVASSAAVAETPEEETEDEDLDNTMTAAPLPNATPALPNQRSVVHETPTAARINGTSEYSDDAPEFADDSAEAAEQDEPEQEAEEAYSTAHTGESQDRPSARGSPSKTKSSPQVQIPSTRKRATPLMEEDEPGLRPSKRAKRSEDDTQDSRMSSIEVDVAPKTTTKSKKRQSEAVDEAEDATPTRSQRSSQRSITAISAEAYDGPTPRVAFSNSAIANTSSAVKFLKKQHGTYVENLTDGFNVLW
jgi:hypothetical protein